ncbi:MAG: hypothetical protein H7A38_01320 [Chlamydiales bacterium]|nr:hypothetical protein [Chlamydiales bacterium]
MTEPIHGLPTPYQIWKIALAIYEDPQGNQSKEEAVNDFIIKLSERRIQLLELNKSWGWPWTMGLFEVDMVARKVLVAAIRGSKGWLNWTDNFINSQSLIPLIFQIANLSKVLKGWERKYVEYYQQKYGKPEWGKIMILTGHSRGGQFASGCLLDHPVWRVTWNGYKVGSDQYHINLVTKNDPLTRTFVPVTKIEVCEGEHALLDFKQRIKELSWEGLLSIQKIATPQLAKL